MTRPAVALGAAVAAWMALHRSAPAVRGWSPPSRHAVDEGPLHATATPDEDADGPVVVLLHGIVGSGRSFGATYDRLPVTVVAPDLLGFGRSMWTPAEDYTAQTHVRAVRETLARTVGADRPLVVVGHSMGGVLGLHLAAALPTVIGVVSVCAPLYDGEEEALQRIGRADPLAPLVAAGPTAERMCRWMCHNRRLAGVLWPILAPRWPWPVAADGVLHTWPAYRGSLESLVLDSGYRYALERLAHRGVPVWLVEGDHDGVPVPGRTQLLASTLPDVAALRVPGAGHALPLSHPTVVTGLVGQILATRRSWPGSPDCSPWPCSPPAARRPRSAW